MTTVIFERGNSLPRRGAAGELEICSPPAGGGGGEGGEARRGVITLPLQPCPEEISVSAGWGALGWALHSQRMPAHAEQGVRRAAGEGAEAAGFRGRGGRIA